jgi:hypothetical protein
MVYLAAGPLVAIVGIVAVFFVLRRKSVEKRSMYSARRSQIEHKVRAARQRTLTPHGRAERPAEQPAGAAASGGAFDQRQPTATYEAPAFEAPPVAPPPPPLPSRPQQAPSQPPWETPSVPPPAPAPAPSSWDFPPATAEPYTPAPVEPFRPAPEPTPMPPSEPAWTPAPKPAEPLTPAKTVAPAASGTGSGPAAGAWSVVSESKESATSAEPDSKKKKKDKGAPTASWQLASGEAPGMEADEPEVRRSSGTIVAVAQYAVLVVGLVMVLIGVLVMVANSHVT